MRKKRPVVASLAEVTIRREGECAVIAYRDPTIATTHFHVGPALHGMSDQDVLDQFNAVLTDSAAAVAEYAAVEVPPGRPQIWYCAPADQWAPRGSVLRAVVDDSGPDGEAVIWIDDQPLSLAEFGRLLCTYAGWGMRIVFVPEELLDEPPPIERRDPDVP